MAAICAVCLRPIVGKGFVIAETEVLHTACAPRAGETVTWRHRREAERLRAQLNEAAARVEDRGRQITGLNALADTLRRERDQAREDIRHARHLIEMAQDLADSEKIVAARARAEKMNADREASAARTEAEQLRREVALYRTLGPTAQTSETPEVDDRNAMDIRFSLIELDKP